MKLFTALRALGQGQSLGGRGHPCCHSHGWPFGFTMCFHPDPASLRDPSSCLFLPLPLPSLSSVLCYPKLALAQGGIQPMVKQEPGQSHGEEPSPPQGMG